MSDLRLFRNLNLSKNRLKTLQLPHFYPNDNFFGKKKEISINLSKNDLINIDFSQLFDSINIHEFDITGNPLEILDVTSLLKLEKITFFFKDDCILVADKIFKGGETKNHSFRFFWRDSKEYHQQLRLYKKNKIQKWISDEGSLTVEELTKIFPLDISTLEMLLDIHKKHKFRKQKFQFTSDGERIFHVPKMRERIQNLVQSRKKIFLNEVEEEINIPKRDIKGLLTGKIIITSKGLLYSKKYLTDLLVAELDRESMIDLDEKSEELGLSKERVSLLIGQKRDISSSIDEKIVFLPEHILRRLIHELEDNQVISTPITTTSVVPGGAISINSTLEDQDSYEKSLSLTKTDLLDVSLQVDRSNVDIEFKLGGKKVKEVKDVTTKYQTNVALKEDGIITIQITNPGTLSGGDKIRVTGYILIVSGAADQADFTLEYQAESTPAISFLILPALVVYLKKRRKNNNK